MEACWDWLSEGEVRQGRHPTLSFDPHQPSGLRLEPIPLSLKLPTHFVGLQPVIFYPGRRRLDE
jgi:hypothetical protein